MTFVQATFVLATFFHIRNIVAVTDQILTQLLDSFSCRAYFFSEIFFTKKLLWPKLFCTLKKVLNLKFWWLKDFRPWFFFTLNFFRPYILYIWLNSLCLNLITEYNNKNNEIWLVMTWLTLTYFFFYFSVSLTPTPTCSPDCLNCQLGPRLLLYLFSVWVCVCLCVCLSANYYPPTFPNLRQLSNGYLSMQHLSWRHLSIAEISQLLLAWFWLNFKCRFLGPLWTYFNRHYDICPGNICPCDICPCK